MNYLSVTSELVYWHRNHVVPWLNKLCPGMCPKFFNSVARKITNLLYSQDQDFFPVGKIYFQSKFGVDSSIWVQFRCNLKKKVSLSFRKTYSSQSVNCKIIRQRQFTKRKEILIVTSTSILISTWKFYTQSRQLFIPFLDYQLVTESSWIMWKSVQ